jgi:hypothetical protein
MGSLLFGPPNYINGKVRTLGKPYGIKMRIVKHVIKMHILRVVGLWSRYIFKF